MPVKPEDEELTILTGGRKLSGWQEIHVIRGVERLPSAFYVRLTERFPGEAAEAIVSPGTTATVSLSGDLILTGYIDQCIPYVDQGRHQVLVKGRSKPEDIVDSSIWGNDLGSWVLNVNTIGEAAERIAKLFKIEVSKPDGDFEIPEPKVFDINPGVTGAQLLEEMARTTGTLIWDDPQGRLVISKVGNTRAGSALIEGQNLEMAQASLTMDQRFGDYYVLGQGYVLGTAFRNQVGHAEDKGVKALGRYRTRIIPWEAPDQDGAYSNLRARWEANRRIGRSTLINCRVTGWRCADGKLWTPNSVVHVTSPSCKLDRDMVIAEVAWERNERYGTVASLLCMPKEGLEPQPLVIQRPVQGLNEKAPG